MKKLIYIICLFLIVVCCNSCERPTLTYDQKIDTLEKNITEIEYKGHCYFMITSHTSHGFDVVTMTHNPDCNCHNN